MPPERWIAVPFLSGSRRCSRPSSSARDDHGESSRRELRSLLAPAHSPEGIVGHDFMDVRSALARILDRGQDAHPPEDRSGMRLQAVVGESADGVVHASPGRNSRRRTRTTVGNGSTKLDRILSHLVMVEHVRASLGQCGLAVSRRMDRRDLDSRDAGRARSIPRNHASRVVGQSGRGLGPWERRESRLRPFQWWDWLRWGWDRQAVPGTVISTRLT